MYISFSRNSKYRTEFMGIAAIGIILCHAVGRQVMLPNSVARILNLGNLGVDLFLLLSGIGMYYSLAYKENNCLTLWYKKRFIRIWWPYFLCTIPTYIIWGIVNEKSILEVLFQISTLSFWFNHEGVWYIAMLIPLYLVTPYIDKLVKNNKNRSLLLFVILVFIIFLGNIAQENTGGCSIIYNLL